jgi:16S rRNA processing protein RimM
LKAGQADWLDGVKTLVLVKPGETESSSFEIEKISVHKDGLIVRLKNWRDRNQAELWRKSSVYIAEELLKAEEGEPIYLKQVLDFTVIDLEGKALGVIRGFASNGSQDLLRVYPPSGGEALIPFVDAFIRHIDFDKQQLTMDLPPGLFDLEPEG